MNIIIIGRKNKNMTGLGKVSSLLYKMLMMYPHIDASFMDDKNLHDNLSCDAIIISGDCAIDENAFAFIRTKTKVPILMFTLIRNNPEDQNEIIRLTDLDNKFGNIFFIMWDNSYKYFKEHEKIADKIVAIPKPIDYFTNKIDFDKRKGICLGQIDKTYNKRFSGHGNDNLNDISNIIINITSANKNIPFYLYGPDCKSIKIPDNVTLLEPRDKMVYFLTNLKLFVSLQMGETFYTVPLEAQCCGTPVLYRHMPQSLTPYIGFSGLKINSANDINFYINKLYYNKDDWNMFSKMSIDNARNVTYKNRYMSMGYILENFISKIGN